jgi:CRISPR-associated protein Cst2
VGQASVNEDGSDSTWADKTFENPAQFIDDDVLGYMDANAQMNRRGILEISRAVSLSPWPGTISPHFASPGSNVAVGPNAKTKQYEPIPYQAEVHDTRYQFTFAMTPDALLKDKFARTERTLHAIRDLRRVASNHSRFLFDFAPEAIILRWTTDPAPRIMFLFEEDDRGRVSLKKLLRRVNGADVEADKLYVGIAFDGIPEVEALKAAGVHVFDGVKAVVAAVLGEIKKSVN